MIHSEHLENVRPGWVASGWLVSVAITSLIVIVLASLGLVTAGDEADGGLWGVVSIALGFWTGGVFTGYRALRAPILHGIGIGLTSLIAWALLNVLIAPTRLLGWQALTPALTSALMLVQMAAAVAGTWVGHRIALRGGLEVQE